MQASLATVHNLWIALLIGALLTGFLWFNAPLLIQGTSSAQDAHLLLPPVGMMHMQLNGLGLHVLLDLTRWFPAHESFA